ncbi:MAG: ester cyclase [Terracidiphilus sp.]|jgi:ketosteroid isomerase-like protein
MNKHLLILAAVLLAWAGVEPLLAQASAADANKAIVRRAFAAFEKGDVATLNELFDPEGPWHAPNGTTIRQGGPFQDLAGSCPMCAKLEERKIVIDVMLTEGDLVSVRSTWSGLYTGTFHGVAVSRKPLTLIYANIYRVSGGRIRENWATADRLHAAEQLGFQLAPAASPEASKK